MPTVGLAVLNGESLALTGSLAVCERPMSADDSPIARHTEDQRITDHLIQGIVIQGVIQGSLDQRWWPIRTLQAALAERR